MTEKLGNRKCIKGDIILWYKKYKFNVFKMIHKKKKDDFIQIYKKEKKNKKIYCNYYKRMVKSKQYTIFVKFGGG